MHTYMIQIKQTRTQTVTVSANSLEEAKQTAIRDYMPRQDLTESADTTIEAVCVKFLPGNRKIA